MIPDPAHAAAAFARARGIEPPFACAIVLGTGLGPLVDEVEDALAIPYRDIPYFPQGGVSGHAARLVAGTLEGRRVLLFQGRAHYYESGDAAAMKVPIGLVKALGAPPLLLTNAAGSTRADWRPPGLALIGDHINLTGRNPLIGEHGDHRFVPMSDAYDAGLREALAAAAERAEVPLHRDGVYLWFSGPSFETPAEIRMARLLGADLVGMSTVPEVILARSMGLRVAALSTITNLAAGIEGANPSHQETKEVALQAAASLHRLVRTFLAGLP